VEKTGRYALDSDHYKTRGSGAPMNKMIPLLCLVALCNLNLDANHKKVWYAPNKFEAYGNEEIEAVTNSLKDGWLAGFGPRTQEFEKRIAQHFGKEFGLFVNSGSSANLLALASLGVGPGDEVITPACTFATTVAPIVQLGATPVFCDVIPGKYVPEVEDVVKLIGPKTKCIMIPNLVGSKPDWKKLRTLTDLPLIEDSCDTMTFTPETDIATTSFYASHIMTACGSGGMVMFNNKKLLDRATMYRDWGRIGDNIEDMSERFNHDIDGIPFDFKFLYGAVGYNFKSSEVNAAFGLIQLNKLEETKKTRRTLIDRYMQNLKGSSYLLPTDSEELHWLAMPLMSENRIELLNFLEKNNVQTRVLFAGNITRHPAYRQYFQEFPNADRIMKEGFLLGAHHGMTLEDVDYVCGLLLKFEQSKQ
jgi:CDP-6-deoxy-D-xylo-4-hexulose-3-dehydrase